VRFDIRGDIEAMPRLIQFGAITADQPVVRNLKLTNNKKAPFRIERVETNSTVISVDLKTPTESRESHEITVTATPGAKSGSGLIWGFP
jgi:hypothetical protein